MVLLRSKLLSLVLVIIVGIGLASVSMAHRLPDGAEQALQAAGVPIAALCGHSQQTPCPDQSCPCCLGAVAVSDTTRVLPAPRPVPTQFALTLTRGTAPPMARRVIAPQSRAPPLDRIG